MSSSDSDLGLLVEIRGFSSRGRQLNGTLIRSTSHGFGVPPALVGPLQGRAAAGLTRLMPLTELTQLTHLFRINFGIWLLRAAGGSRTGCRREVRISKVANI